MFEPSDHPRIFACPPGADFPKMLVDGFRDLIANSPPETAARAEIFVNTQRMQRKIQALFDDGPAALLPRVRLITDLANDPSQTLGAAVSPLRRRLELAQLISLLLEQEPDIAPASATFDLADSLAKLLVEMHDEDVHPDAISGLDVTDRSGHWLRSQKFLNIVAGFYGTQPGQLPDAAALQRANTVALIERWKNRPPTHPVIVAGSTGSRGSTALLMRAVARLPQGAVILPGFDFELPDPVWSQLSDAMTSEDHPQFRFARLMSDLEILPSQVNLWGAGVAPQIIARNRLFSLALRPAPFTSQWMREGPELENSLQSATADMALIEAPSERAEATAIALALRKAADDGITAALVTPDKVLTRRVTAALERWNIEPDVSIGAPLALSAPGRLLRHVSGLFGQFLTGEALLVLLKHPLTNTGSKMRGQHLLWTRALELKLRREGPAMPSKASFLEWAEADDNSAEKQAWASWVARTVFGHSDVGNDPLETHLDRHIRVVEALADGPDPETSDQLWSQEAGRVAQGLIAEMQREAMHGGVMSAADYNELVRFVLSSGEVRNPVRPHTNIMIWGTLEARVQGAELVILGGLNDATWPELPGADPWLNRDMRMQSGLLLPERRIGLSAHDFQQSVAAQKVILSRSLRSADAETVPSRWINRLTNLMTGLPDAGPTALENMRDRGNEWLDLARVLETPSQTVPAESRPAPCPPIAARPRQLSVTAVTRLIRDPYAIYANRVLRLRKLDPLHRKPDAPLRGTVLHAVLENFIRQNPMSDGTDAARDTLLLIARATLLDLAPWPAARALWLAKLERVADVFLTDELDRQTRATPEALEVRGSLLLRDIDFTLTATADRIDRMPNGEIIIYDYKTGSVPTRKQLEFFDKQLLLEAVMSEDGSFKGIAPGRVAEVAHIGLGPTPKFLRQTMEPGQVDKVMGELIELLNSYQSTEVGYTSRRAMALQRFAGDYDHLARFGEWDETQTPVRVEVGQ
ncbi:MAG: double-strand break repair protein AddB [Marinosulfonomonas sp.]|nr:double-strand break repair protein AddB [Marinosulfonomonas sp.]